MLMDAGGTPLCGRRRILRRFNNHGIPLPPESTCADPRSDSCSRRASVVLPSDAPTDDVAAQVGFVTAEQVAIRADVGAAAAGGVEGVAGGPSCGHDVRQGVGDPAGHVSQEPRTKGRLMARPPLAWAGPSVAYAVTCRPLISVRASWRKAQGCDAHCPNCRRSATPMRRLHRAESRL